MHCYVYKGHRHDDHYLYLSAEIGPHTAADIPASLLAMLGKLSLVVDFELSADRKLPQAEAQQVMQDIERQGFYLQMPKKELRAAEERYFN